MKQTIRFEKSYRIGPFRDAIDLIFPYPIVRFDLIGAPEEKSSILRYHLRENAGAFPSSQLERWAEGGTISPSSGGFDV